MLKNGRIYPGTVMQFTLAITDADGNAVDPDTVTLHVMDPCGTESTYAYGTDAEIQQASAGNYTGDITPDKAGRWHLRWVTTGAGKAVVKEENFIVRTSPFVDDCFAIRDYA